MRQTIKEIAVCIVLAVILGALLAWGGVNQW